MTTLVHCDFCYVQVRLDAVWAHVTAPFTIPNMHGVRGKDDDGEWAACEDCHGLIQAKDVEGLLKRSVTLDPLTEKVPNAMMWKRDLFKMLVNLPLLYPPHKGRPRRQFDIFDGQHRDGGSL